MEASLCMVLSPSCCFLAVCRRAIERVRRRAEARLELHPYIRALLARRLPPHISDPGWDIQVRRPAGTHFKCRASHQPSSCGLYGSYKQLCKRVCMFVEQQAYTHVVHTESAAHLISAVRVVLPLLLLLECPYQQHHSPSTTARQACTAALQQSWPCCAAGEPAGRG